ncbi:hypothetical protein [Pseudoalteromonas sp. T1lg10]|uniref:hypothetical protein n=1 Tax=Pseudoalteromonas sp. T1lg10 TaxID=2077093 RepID=UPI000CF62FD9|nr:hypothetical protein [Pseudoalteromonas sp. T1lg10]
MSFDCTNPAQNMPIATTNILDIKGQTDDIVKALFHSLHEDLYIGCKSKLFVKEGEGFVEFEQKIHREIKASIRKELQLSNEINPHYEWVKFFNEGAIEVYFFYLTHEKPNHELLIDEISLLNKQKKDRLVSGLLGLHLKTEFLEQAKEKYEFSPTYFNSELYLSVHRSGREKKDGTTYLEALKPELYFSPSQELCFNLVKKVFRVNRLEAITVDLDDTKALFKTKDSKYIASREVSATKYSKRKFMSFGDAFAASINYAQNLLSDILQGILNRLDIEFSVRHFSATHVTDNFISADKVCTSDIVIIDNLGDDFDVAKKDKALSQLYSEFESSNVSIVQAPIPFESLKEEHNYIVLNASDGSSSIQRKGVEGKVFTGFWDAYRNTPIHQREDLDYYTQLKIARFESQSVKVIQGLNFAETDKEVKPRGSEVSYAISPHKLNRINSEIWLKRNVFIHRAFDEIDLPDANLQLVYIRKLKAKKNNFFASVVDVNISSKRLVIEGNQLIKSEKRLALECPYFGDRQIHDDSFYLYDKDRAVLLTSYSTIRVPQIIGNSAVDTISISDSDELVVNRQSGVDVSVLPYYLLPKERKQYHHVYLQDVGPDLFYFVAPIQRPNQDIAKQNRVYNLLTFNAGGKLLSALKQPITHIFFSSFTEDILRINEVSKSSLLEKIARLYVEN